MRVSSTASAKRPGSLLKPGASSVDHAGRERERDREQHELADQQQREDVVGEQFRDATGAAGAANAGIGRHERRVERALGEDRAEMVGQPQRHEKRIGDRPGAEDGGQHDVAHESGDARQQRETADYGHLPDHAVGQAPRSASPSHLAGPSASRAQSNGV